MLKKLLFLYFIALIFISASSTLYSQEKIQYQSAKVIKIEKRQQQSSSTSTFPRPRSYDEPSRDERKIQENDAVGVLLSNAFESANIYLIALESEEIKMLVKYEPSWSWNRSPDLFENSSVKVRFNARKDKLFIKQLNGKELETKVLSQQKLS